MKVNSKNVSQDLGISKTNARGLEKSLGQTAKGTSSSEEAGSAKVELSSKAQSMLKAKEIASDNSVNEAKIERLQNLIDSGQYKTDAASIADKLVDEHLISI